jgi:hypothetical protein
VSLQPAFLAGRYDRPPAPRNPLGIDGANELFQTTKAFGLLTLGIAVLFTIVSLFRRNRRATGAEREQFRWLGWAGVWTIVLLFMSGPGIYGGFLPDPLALRLMPATPFLLAMAMSAIPAAIAVGILRYRLWEIDRIISRTVSYALVTTIVVSIYVLVAIVIPATVASGKNTPDALIAAATLLAAGTVGPLRRRVQERVDRRFNRERYDAALTIDAFTARLKEQVDLDTLGVEIEAVVDRTMRPRHQFLWLNEP